MNTTHQKVIDYYSHPETKLGFDLILWGSKHFGFYPSGKSDISEKEAQILMQDLVAKKLNLKKNQFILDAGCGQGVVSTYLAKKYRTKIIGITLVPFEVKKAKKLALQLDVQNKTQYQIMDYSDTTFPDNYFDAIYTMESLSHSPNIKKTLQEFLRILKPGGKIALFEYTIAPVQKFNDWEKKMLDLVIEGSAMTGLKDFRHNQFTTVIERVGFINVKEENISGNIKPSFYRLYRLAKYPYKIIKLLGLQKFFINVTACVEYYKMAEKGLFRYCIFTAQKPMN